MPNRFDISQLNPLRFYEMSDNITEPPVSSGGYDYNYLSFDPNLNERGFDNDFQARNNKSWQAELNYVQPFQKGDYIRVQWLGLPDVPSGSYAGDPYQVYLVNCDFGGWSLIPHLKPSTPLLNGHQVREVFIPCYNLDGRYILMIRCKKTSATDKLNVVFSEPFDVQEFHPETMLFEYENSSNVQGIIFDYETSDLNPRFQFRVQGAIVEMKPESVFEVYEDEPLNLTMIEGVPTRKWKMQIGVENYFIPDWMLDKVERISLMNRWEIDGQRYTREKDAKMEIKPVKNTMLSSGSLNVRQSDNDHSKIVSEINSEVIGEVLDTSYLYVGGMDVGPIIVTNIPIDKVFKGRNELLAYLNTYFLEEYSKVNGLIKGQFYIDNRDQLFFKPYDSGEVGEFDGAQLTDFFQYGIRFDISTVVTIGNLSIDVTSPGSPSDYAYYYSDGSPTLVQSTVATDNITETFSTQGKKYTSFLFLKNMEQISALSSDNILVGLGGQLNPEMISADFSSNIIRNTDRTLLDFVTGLQDFFLSINNMPSSSVDISIIMLYDAVKKYGYSASSFEIDGQSPTAPPSDGVILSLVPLIKQNNFITYD